MRQVVVTILGFVLLLWYGDAAHVVLPKVDNDVLPLSADREETVISRSSNNDDGKFMFATHGTKLS